MKVFILISLAFLNSLLLGCATTNEKSILEERAGYGFNPPPIGMNGSSDTKYVPTRVPEKVVVAWLHPKELPSKDYFWGAWISTVIAPESWEMKKVAVSKPEKKQPKGKVERPLKSPPKLKRP